MQVRRFSRAERTEACDGTLSVSGSRAVLSAAQAERLLEWAAARAGADLGHRGSRGLGHLLSQQLLSAGEQVLDVQPKRGERVRLLAAGN